jgi:hypothetical protein
LTVYYGFNLAYVVHKTWRLDDANKRASVKFTARNTKTVTFVHVEMRSASGSPTYRVGLQEDKDGKPSDVWLTSGTFKPSDVATPGAWNKVAVSSIELEESKIYHIVIQYESGTIGASNYSELNVHEVETVRLFPEGFEDGDYDHLRSTDGGASWTSYPTYAVSFLLEYSDGSGYGFSYYEEGDHAIYGNNWRQMYLQPTKRMVLSSVEVYIKKTGTPPADLTLVLRNETDAVDEATVTINQGDVGTFYSFVAAAFPTGIVVYANKIYTLTLKSPSSDASNYYMWEWWSAYGAMIYRESTWGGTDNCMRFSNDGGSSWDAYNSDDYPFRFTVTFNPALKGGSHAL